MRASTGASGSSHWAIPRRSLSARLFKYEVIFQRWGYWPVVSAQREGEQIGELT